MINGCFFKCNSKRSKRFSKRKDLLDKYNRLPHNYQSNIGYDILIQNVIFKEIINLMGTTVVDIDIELKMKISGIKYLESRLCNFISI